MTSTVDVVAEWPQAWRQPGLLALASRGEADRATAARAVLDGILHPVVDVADGVQRLIELGEFAAARALMGRSPSVLSAEHAGELGERLERAVGAASNRLGERAHRLRIRAAAVGQAVDPAWADLLADSATAAERELDEFEKFVDAVADDRVTAIRARFPELDRERVLIAEACLRGGEYDVAESVVTHSDESTWLSLPATVPHLGGWAYADEPADSVLGWYLRQEESPADFEQCLPFKTDTKAWSLIRALHDVHDELTEESARELGRAIDDLVNDIPVNHRARAAGSGYDVELRGLVDPRFSWLALPKRLTLHIGPTRPAVGGTKVWLPVGGTDPEPAAGLAVLEPSVLFQLLDPAGAHLQSTPNRRVALLRHVCAQLAFDQVVDIAGADLGSGADTRATLLWVLDLLGLVISPEVPDMVVYLSAGMPEAMAAIIRELCRIVGPAEELAHEDLVRLRDDTEAVRAVTEAVFGPVADHLDACVVYGALLGRAARLGVASVTPDQLDAELDELTLLLMEAHEKSGERDRDFPIGRIDLAAAGNVLRDAGLLGPGAEYELPGQGLVALLGRPGLTEATTAWLTRFHKERDDLEDNTRLMLRSRTSWHYEHARKGHLYALAQLTASLGVGVDNAGLRERIRAQQALIDEFTAIEKGDIDALLHSSVFDFAGLAREIADGQRKIRDLDFEVVEPDGTTSVTAIKVLVHLTLSDLYLNALQAMEAAESRTRRIRVTLRYEDSETQRYLLADIEDSGPGYGRADRSRLDEIRKTYGMSGGEGMRHAKANLAACRGRLERMPDSADLGGACLRVRLPLAE
ncbi:hypothetical protein [Saccharothrix lopnurensis]|uniref:Histidine kinase/DNA gyrase B/HSP90-like ATPase n=1 Tax=Saccharothrix lopnurensis TaxID=1670621 RepID=A0ABW1P271_9PSEU